MSLRTLHHAPVRAALLAIVIAIQLVLAIPSTERITEGSLRRPEAREELDRWMALLDTIGIDWTREEVSTGLIRVNDTVKGAHSTLVKPIRPVKRYLGFNQAWALFASPDTHPNLLVIEVYRSGGPWKEVYRSLDPDKTELRAQLRFRRMRGVHDAVGARPSGAYLNFVDWVAGTLFDRHPEVQRVRVSVIRLHSTPPSEPRDPAQTLKHQVLRTRAQVQP